MPTFSSFKAYSAEWEKVARELDTQQRRKITRAQAEAGQKIADQFARRDLGPDRAFSGWKRGDPIPLDTHLKFGRNDSTLILPKFPGGWTVAQQGRNAAGGIGGRFQGPAVNMRTGRTSRTKSGVIRAGRSRRGVRYNGVTRGKDTASDAVKVMERELPPIAEKAYRKVLVKHFDVT